MKILDVFCHACIGSVLQLIIESIQKISPRTSLKEHIMKFKLISKHAGKFRPSRILVALAAAVFLLVSLPILLVWYGEHERKVLLESYQIPKNVLSEILPAGRKPISRLMVDDETTVCTINSYSGVENVLLLNKAQRDSLPKRLLPSEDLTWYLLFFTESQISRIFLIDVFSIQGTSGESPICISRGGSYESVKRGNFEGGVVELKLFAREE